MKSKTRRILVILLALVFLGSSAMMLWQGQELQKSKRAYQDAESLVALPALPEAPSESVQTAESDPYAELLSSLDLSSLQAINQDVRAWIIIPNTTISYPLMQGTDNAFYLKHDYRKKPSGPGAIFLDSRSAPTLTDFNSIIYGHRMKNGTMFEALKNYSEQAFFNAHPDVYIVLPEGSYHYRIFAAYEDSTHGESYRTDFDGDETQKQAFLDAALQNSWIQGELTPSTSDRILTLSTCTGRGYAKRLVIHASLQSVVPTQVEAEGAAP